MDFDLDQRTASLNVGEFSDFTLGPRDASGGPSGLWRAQLGTHWHQQLRAQTSSENSEATFEVPITGSIFHHGWTLTLTGRIDQLVPPATANGPLTLREIKTVTRPIPADESELRAEYPAYFVQLAAYAALHRFKPGFTTPIRSELHFVEASSGLAQTITLGTGDEALFQAQLERVTEFLNLRLRARERLRNLRYRPPFAKLRPGQETTEADLTAALKAHPIVLFEAPTGFGKTGVLLELALGQLRAGRFERLIYLTSKATGQLQVMRTLADMTEGPAENNGTPTLPVAAWLMRPKREHCIHSVFHCSRESCPHLDNLEGRWPRSGLARFYLLENHPRDIDTLRTAGKEVSICPYEITRAALPFNDVWIGDYNYIFSPSNRGIFTEQPGYEPARTLLVIDEAHNLPSRVADVHTRAFDADQAADVEAWLYRTRAPSELMRVWEQWAHFLKKLDRTDAHSLATEDDARDLIDSLAKLILNTPLDYEQMPQEVSEQLWALPEFSASLADYDLPRLWWSPRFGQLVVTCLDAAKAIAPALREFGGAILASATLTPAQAFAESCGLDNDIVDPKAALPKSAIQKLVGPQGKRVAASLFADVTTGAGLLAFNEAWEAARPFLVRAHTPWRDHAYDVAIDVRVETSYMHRTRFYPVTAATIISLNAAAEGGNVAVFFPSYAYAEQIKEALVGSFLNINLQPRLNNLAEQNAWVEQALASPGVMFLVLGSSFAEGIDLLGGRVSHAMVVGPALPEVNPVQRARLVANNHLGRDMAARRVYQIPGLQKVNQALGRLVRAPGHHAKILLHCRRFAEKSYHDLLAPEYRSSLHISSDHDLAAWLSDEPIARDRDTTTAEDLPPLDFDS